MATKTKEHNCKSTKYSTGYNAGRDSDLYAFNTFIEIVAFYRTLHEIAE